MGFLRILSSGVGLQALRYSFMRLASKVSVREMVGRVMPPQCKRARHSKASKRSGSGKKLVEGSAGRGRPLDSE